MSNVKIIEQPIQLKKADLVGAKLDEYKYAIIRTDNVGCVTDTHKHGVCLDVTDWSGIVYADKINIVME